MELRGPRRAKKPQSGYFSGELGRKAYTNS